MSLIPAVSCPIYVQSAHAAAPTSTDLLPTGTTASVTESVKTVDATTLGSGGYEVQAPTLKSFSIDLTINGDGSDTVGAILTTAFGTLATVWVTIVEFPSATTGNKGWTYPCTVTERSVKLDPSGLMQPTFKLVNAGSPIAF